jgi:hypothetical protein
MKTRNIYKNILNSNKRSIFKNSRKFFVLNTNANNTNINDEIKEYPKLIKNLFEFNIKTKKIPCFEIYSSQVEILNQPFDFYLAIIVSLNLICRNLLNQQSIEYA